MSKKNKYKDWHDQIIRRGRSRKLTADFERHHIKPRCLGGSSSKRNIVKLTYQEHFLVHWLLIKFMRGEERRLMQHALFRMASRSKDNGGRIVAAWQYEVSRKAQVAAMTGKAPSPNCGAHFRTEEFKQQQRKRMKGNSYKLGVKESEVSRQRKSIAKMGAAPTKGCTGMCWITDGRSNKLLTQNAPIPKGFYKGRIVWWKLPTGKRGPQRNPCKNRPTKPKVEVVCKTCKRGLLVVPYMAKYRKFCSPVCYHNSPKAWAKTNASKN